MLRKTLISSAAMGAISMIASAASATNWGSSTSGWHTHTCYCGHITCPPTTPPPPPPSTTGTPPPPPPTTSGTPPPPPPTTSGTEVPEPGMLGMAGLGLIGLGAMRLRRRKVKRTVKLDD